MALVWLLAVLAVVPGVPLRGAIVSAEYLLGPIALGVIGYLVAREQRLPVTFWTAVAFWLCIIGSTIISSTSVRLSAQPGLGLSLDTFSYIGKGAVFLLGFIIVYRYREAVAGRIVRALVAALTLAMIVGLWQWLPVPLADELLILYARGSENILAHVDRELLLRRVPGVAYMATAHGALAGFAAVVAYSLSLREGWKVSYVVLFALSVVNLMASLSRLGMLALVVVPALMPLLTVRSPLLRRRSVRHGAYAAAALGLMAVALLRYLGGALDRIAARWLLLLAQIEAGGNRLAQIARVREVMGPNSGLLTWLFGTSRAGQHAAQEAGTFGHVEVEFVNILYLYGIAGFIAHYLFVAWLMYVLWRTVPYDRVGEQLATVALTALAGLTAYQVASVGYFFFRELHVGFFVWFLTGAGLGAAVCLNERWRAAERSDSRAGVVGIGVSPA